MRSLSFRRELPFCPLIFTGEEVPDGFSTFGLSRAKFFKWAYRVKNWKVTAAIGGSIASDPIGDETDILTSTFDGFSETAFSPEPPETFREEKFSCGLRTFPSWSAGDEHAGVIDPENNYSFINAEIFFGLFTGAPGAAYNSDTKLWHPRISIGLFCIAENNAPAGWITVAPASEGEIAEAEASGEITVSVDGVEFTIPWARDGGPGPLDSVIDPSSIVIEPIDYWPWNPEDGLGPIVDSETGAILRQL